MASRGIINMSLESLSRREKSTMMICTDHYREIFIAIPISGAALTPLSVASDVQVSCIIIIHVVRRLIEKGGTRSISY